MTTYDETTYDEPTTPVTVIVDPRVKQRWVDNRRVEGRRRLRWLAGVAVLGAVGLLAAGVLYSPIMAVRRVQITGPGGLPVRVLQQAAGVGHQPLIRLDPSQIAARLEAVPLVGVAHVERSWPDTLRIQVTTRTPVAQALVGGRTVELDATGRVLADLAAPNTELPIIQGLSPAPVAPGGWVPGGSGPAAHPDESPAVLLADPPDITAAAIAVSANLSGLLAGRVEVVAVAGPNLTLTVASGTGTETVQVLFGDQSELSEKLTALATLVAGTDLSRDRQVDLRTPYAPVLTPTFAPSNVSTQAGGF
jgi:POTRA domain, FtsQ-type